MHFHTPFTSPYVNRSPPGYHGGHFVCSFHDDSGYVSEESDSDSDTDNAPSLPFGPELPQGEDDQFAQGSLWTQHHRAAAFVDAQWSHPTTFSPCLPYDDSLNDSRRTHDLPRSLPFEQQRSNHQSSLQLEPTITRNCEYETLGREPSHPASGQDFRPATSPRSLDEDTARISTAPLSLSNNNNNNNIESNKTEKSSLSSSPLQQYNHSPKLEIHPKTAQSSSSATFFFFSPESERSEE